MWEGWWLVGRVEAKHWNRQTTLELRFRDCASTSAVYVLANGVWERCGPLSEESAARASTQHRHGQHHQEHQVCTRDPEAIEHLRKHYNKFRNPSYANSAQPWYLPR